MKIFLSTDMEGTAGVVDWEQCLPAAAGVRARPRAAAGRGQRGHRGRGRGRRDRVPGQRLALDDAEPAAG